MRRTSKFSFPIPGRKASSNIKIETEHPAPRIQPLSKAQRILGTAGNLNIDSPIRDEDGSWRSRPVSSGKRPSSSGMSIAISESTEDDDIYASNTESWDGDEAIHPPRHLRGKASSTLLGYSYKGDGNNSVGVPPIGPGIREEKSSSTLRSYYDRAKTPLAVSQQTSASSARDLALRKGHPPASPSLPRSPLLHVDCSEETAVDNGFGYFQGKSEKAVKKKPSRLNIARLFHKKSRDSSLLSPGDQIRPPSILSGLSEGGSSRKLTKVPSKPKQKSAIATPVNQLRDEKSVQFKNKEESKVNDLYEHYENRAFQNAVPSPVPSPRLPTNAAERPKERPKPSHLQTNGVSHHDLRIQPLASPGSSRNSQVPNNDAEFGSAPHPPWDSASTYSDSSKATRTSRKSVFSSSNLQQNSILSLSSDSDSDSDAHSQDLRDRELAKFPRPSTSNPSSIRNHASQNGRIAHQRKRSSTLNSPTSPSQNDKFLTIPIPLPSPVSPRISAPWSHPPLPSPVSPRISGPWYPPPIPLDAQSMHSAHSMHSSHSGRLSRQSTLRSTSRRAQSPSSVSGRSIEAQTPGATTPRSSRLMAVTAQEQALLSALRNKRARMRDEILAEHTILGHESALGPHAQPQRQPPSPPSTAGTQAPRSSNAHGGRASYGSATTTKGKQRVLLYLDRPVPAPHGFDTAEPSPDLSDFLSFGSDEDEESTPRSSWLPPAVVEEEEGLNVGRPDSVMEGLGVGMGVGTAGRTSRSQARLSAVGKSFGVQTSRHMHEVKVLGTERDEEEEGVVWGM